MSFSRHLPALLVTVLLLGAVGCAESTQQPADAASEPAEAVEAANPYAAYAGTWTVGVYAPDSDEAASSFTLLATESGEGWSTEWAYLDAPVPVNQVVMEGDSLRMELVNYPSSLRADRTVVSVWSTVYASGDSLAGRFAAEYDDGETMTGVLRGSRAQ